MKRLIDHPVLKKLLEKLLDGWDTIKATWLQADKKRLMAQVFPYLLVGYFINKASALYHLCNYGTWLHTLSLMAAHTDRLFSTYWPSFNGWDVIAGIAGTALLYFYVWQKKRSSKKFRQGEEYGSARWGTPKDIKPYMDAKFERNVLLTETERITMNGRPKRAKYARNKNILVIGGSGSGKTRFFLKPNLMQMHSSYVVTDPKGLV